MMSRWRIPIFLLLSLGAFLRAAETEGLVQELQFKITPEMAGSPIKGTLPPWIWGSSFSPDGKTLAVGVQFIEKASGSAKIRASYSAVLMLDSNDLQRVRTRIEVPRPPTLLDLLPFRWSPSARFLDLGYFGNFGQTVVLDVSDRKVLVVTHPTCTERGFSAGDVLVHQCREPSRLLFTDLNGSAIPDRLLPEGTSLVALDSKSRRFAAASEISGSHTIAVFDQLNAPPVQQWSLPGPVSGLAFVDAADVLCALGSATSGEQTLTCWDVRTGLVVGVHAFGSHERAASLRRVLGSSYVVLDLNEITMIPKLLRPLLGTDSFVSRRRRVLWSFELNRSLASWQATRQRKMKNVEMPSASSFESQRVVELGGGKITVYRVR